MDRNEAIQKLALELATGEHLCVVYNTENGTGQFTQEDVADRLLEMSGDCRAAFLKDALCKSTNKANPNADSLILQMQLAAEELISPVFDAILEYERELAQ